MKSGKHSALLRRENRQGWLSVLPVLALELLVCAYPIGMVIVKSFTNWDGMFKSDPVGLRNYIRIFSDPNFWTLLKNTGVFLLTIPVQALIGMIIAVILNDRIPGWRFFRLVYYLPSIISMTVVGLLYKIMFSYSGPLTALLHQMQDFLEQYRTLRGVQLELFPYTKPMELLADIEAGVRFDVLFLDVLMPGINGINAAREIRRYDTAVQIIFVTSSSEFAVQSYVVGAYYYQLKPIWKDSFFRLTDAVLAECRKRTQHSLILRCKSGVTRITLDSLEYCEVQGRTLVFHLLDGTVIESSGSMDELARQLADYPGFLRPHRSYLVNMEYVQNITAKSITMESLAEVPLPHGRFTAVRDQYLEYSFAGKKVVL